MRLLFTALLILPVTAFAQETPTAEDGAEAAAEAVETAVEATAAAAEEAAAEVEEAATSALSIEPTPEGGEQVTMLSDVLFPFGEATLRAEAEDVLREAADVIGDKQGIVIQGHTDDIGSDAFNEALGLARAEAVRDWFVASGKAPEAFEVKSAGEGAPKVPNRADNGADLPENRAKNRRVEFVLPGEN
ncbi:MAG: OmpA family protein [Pseudomonadota bacterium]